MTTFKMFSGDTRRLLITVLDEETNHPLDLTGARVEWAMAASVKGTPLVTKSTTSPDGVFILSPPTDGKFMVEILPEDTAGRVGKFYHESVVTEANGDVSTVATGNIKVVQTVL